MYAIEKKVKEKKIGRASFCTPAIWNSIILDSSHKYRTRRVCCCFFHNWYIFLLFLTHSLTHLFSLFLFCVRIFPFFFCFCFSAIFICFDCYLRWFKINHFDFVWCGCCCCCVFFLLFFCVQRSSHLVCCWSRKFFFLNNFSIINITLDRTYTHRYNIHYTIPYVSK